MRFSWAHPHQSLLVLAVAGGLLAWYLEATRGPRQRASARQRWSFAFGLLLLVLAASWPLAVLARSSSLLALVLQRQLVVLGAAPLVLLGLPEELAARLSRPKPIDAFLRWAGRPVAAIATTTILLGVTALPWTVDASARSSGLLVACFLANFLAGVVLWSPAIQRFPAMPRMTELGVAAYLVVQSVAPTFLSFAWIFALHPLYDVLRGQEAALGISALTDQQLAGYLAKLGTFGVLWSVAYWKFFHAADDKRDDEEEEPALRWVDVERQLERSARLGVPQDPGSEGQGPLEAS